MHRHVAEHPFGPVNTNARRMRPIQLAMLTMVQSDPGLLLELMRQLGGDRASKKAGASSGGDSRAEGAADALEKLLRDKEMLERQLEEVSEEAGRLQVGVGWIMGLGFESA